jgi:carboxypeptidase T
LSEFVIAHKNIKTAISYHSYGNLILYPYGYTYDDVPAGMNAIDHQAFVAIANEMQRTTGYHAQQGSDLYITDGDFNDWMYGAERRYAFTIELGGGGFYPGDEIIPGETQRNHAAAIYVAKIANCPTKVVGKGCRRS